MVPGPPSAHPDGPRSALCCAQVKGDMGSMKKQVHDMTRTRKYVSPQAAETMRQKKASSPAKTGS